MSSEVIAYLRVSEIANNRRTGSPGVLPVSAATWWKWVAEGKAPAPIKLSPGVTVWRTADIISFAEKLGGGGRMNGPTIPSGGLPFDPSRPLVRLYAVVPAAPGWESTVYGPPGQMALTRGVAAFALMSDGVKSWLEPLHASGASRDVTCCHD